MIDLIKATALFLDFESSLNFCITNKLINANPSCDCGGIFEMKKYRKSVNTQKILSVILINVENFKTSLLIFFFL